MGFSVSSKYVLGVDGGVVSLVSSNTCYVKALHITGSGNDRTRQEVTFFDARSTTGITASTAGEVFKVDITSAGGSNVQIPKPGMLFQYGVVVHVDEKASVTIFYEVQ